MKSPVRYPVPPHTKPKPTYCVLATSNGVVEMLLSFVLRPLEVPLCSGLRKANAYHAAPYYSVSASASAIFSPTSPQLPSLHSSSTTHHHHHHHSHHTGACRPHRHCTRTPIAAATAPWHRRSWLGCQGHSPWFSSSTCHTPACMSRRLAAKGKLISPVHVFSCRGRG